MDMRHVETLSSLMDGEDVDPDVLEQALGNQEAIPLLVKAVRLRQAVRGGMAMPSPDARRRCEAAMHAEAARLRGGSRRFLWVVAVVAAVAGAGILGVEIGARRGPFWAPVPAADATLSRPPEVSRPDLPAAGGGTRTRRTLRFDPSRNWTEGGL